MFIGLLLEVCFLKYGECVFFCLRLMVFLNGVDCIFSSLYLDIILMKVYFVLDVGEILVCCVRYFIFFLYRGFVVVKEYFYIGYEFFGVFYIVRFYYFLIRVVI